MQADAISPTSGGLSGGGVTAREAALRARSEELEAAFLSEMLGHAGLGSGEGAFNGGIGETQFASFLRDEQAKAMVEAGGIGLAESIFRALSVKEASHADR
jgi:peptidoglycan hydrolase FlgJ